MMTNSVPVTEWWQSPDLVDEIVIDWPQIHRKVGMKRWRWLSEREQLGAITVHLEQRSGKWYRMVAEFHNSKTQTEYILKWN